MVDAGAIAYLSQLIDSEDAKLKRQVFSALSQIAKHTVELAELVVEAEIFPSILPNLQDTDEYVQKKTREREMLPLYRSELDRIHGRKEAPGL